MAIPLAAAAAAGGGTFAAGYTAMTALTVASMAMSATGMLVSGMQQAQQQKDMYAYQSAVANNQAIAAQQSAQYEAARQSEKANKLKAQQETMFASSGMVGTEGSPLALMADTAASAELDRLSILHNGQLAYLRGQSQATGYNFAGQIAQDTAYTKMGTSLLGLAGNAAVGAAKDGWFNSTSTPEPITNTTDKYIAASGVDF